MLINAYLNFDGNCQEAFKFYEQVLGGTIVAMIANRDAPADVPTPPDRQDKIMHARLIVGHHVLMGSDTPPQHRATPQGFSVSIGVNEAAEAERVFAALADGGRITFPLQETFWAVRFGAVTDRFGTPWMVNCEKPMGG